MINAEIQELIKGGETSICIFEELEERLETLLAGEPDYHRRHKESYGRRESAKNIWRARAIQILIKQVESVRNVAVAYEDANELKALEVWETINNYNLLKTELQHIEEQFKSSDFEHLLLFER